MAAAGEEECLELELEVAAILCDLKRTLRARDRRRRQRWEEAPVIPSWGRRRLRSVLEDGKPAAAGVAERDGAASPDTPLAFPDSVPEEEEDAAKKSRAQAEWVQEQRVVVASLSQENADLLKQIEEYRARLLSSRSANESLKQLHKMRQQREQEEHARRMRGPLAALGLDLNEPPDEEEEAAAARASAQERYWQVQKAAVTAEARRRRLEILRAKVVSCRTRRVVG